MVTVSLRVNESLSRTGQTFLEAHPVLDYIRKNIPLERVVEVEKKVSDLEQYVSEELMETVYRGHKGSFKAEYSKSRGMKFLWLILYLLTGEPKEWSYRGEEKLPPEIDKVLRKHFAKPDFMKPVLKYSRGCFRKYESYFHRYADEYAKARTGRKTKTGWILVDPYVFKMLGGEIFFYCTLKALLKVIRRALEDSTYDYHVMSWEEGITEYLVRELKVVGEAELEATFKEAKKLTKKEN